MQVSTWHLLSASYQISACDNLVQFSSIPKTSTRFELNRIFCADYIACRFRLSCLQTSAPFAETADAALVMPSLRQICGNSLGLLRLLKRRSTYSCVYSGSRRWCAASLPSLSFAYKEEPTLRSIIVAGCLLYIPCGGFYKTWETCLKDNDRVSGKALQTYHLFYIAYGFYKDLQAYLSVLQLPGGVH